MPARLTASATRILHADPVMSGLIGAVGPYRLGPHALRVQHSPFEALARAIAHQQLNGIAAERILGRLVALFAPDSFPTPAQLLQTEEVRLRAVGLSGAKVAALKDLAAKTLSGVVPTASELQGLADLEIIERLTAVRGIGRWTVEMLLIFQLERADVLPIDDFGIRNGFRLAYGLAGMPLPRALAEFGERWKPHRSIAAWYLWRAVELAREQRLPRCARPPRIAVSKLARKVASAVTSARRRLERRGKRDAVTRSAGTRNGAKRNGAKRSGVKRETSST